MTFIIDYATKIEDKLKIKRLIGHSEKRHLHSRDVTIFFVIAIIVFIDLLWFDFVVSF